MNDKLCLYVWHNCLTDYTDGVMFAMAYSVEEARQKILEDCKFVDEDLNASPSCYYEPVGFAVWGGG